MLFLDFVQIGLFGVRIIGFSIYQLISSMYPVYMILVIVQLLLIFFSFGILNRYSWAVGIVVIVTQIIFLLTRVNVILGGDVSWLLAQVASMLSNNVGMDVTPENIKMILTPLLNGGIGFYVTLVLNIIYIALAFIGVSAIQHGRSETSGKKDITRPF